MILAVRVGHRPRSSGEARKREFSDRWRPPHVPVVYGNRSQLLRPVGALAVTQPQRKVLAVRVKDLIKGKAIVQIVGS